MKKFAILCSTHSTNDLLSAHIPKNKNSFSPKSSSCQSAVRIQGLYAKQAYFCEVLFWKRGLLVLVVFLEKRPDN